MLCGLAEGLDALTDVGVPVGRILLIGGGARSEAVRRIAPAVLGHPVSVPPPGEYVADGAAVQAAWTLAGGDEPPRYVSEGTENYDAKPLPELRKRYSSYRDRSV
jgi:xylulokinase